MDSKEKDALKWNELVADSENTVLINLELMVNLKPSDEWEPTSDDMRQEAIDWIAELLIDAKYSAVESIHDLRPTGEPCVTGVYVHSAEFTNNENS